MASLTAFGDAVWNTLLAIHLSALVPEATNKQILTWSAALCTGDALAQAAAAMGLGPAIMYQRAPGLEKPNAKLLKVGFGPPACEEGCMTCSTCTRVEFATCLVFAMRMTGRPGNTSNMHVRLAPGGVGGRMLIQLVVQCTDACINTCVLCACRTTSVPYGQLCT